MTAISSDMIFERRSSAVTLSDMEIFVFPELMYSLMLANMMSPRIWRWLDDDWFEGIEKHKPYRRIVRLKQFIMDRYVFNLDLETWGLTTRQSELDRFSRFISPDDIMQSNALFGYEGDRYYFDIDIRTHFGLDKYDGDVIPYWKTETVEAMDAFRHREGYSSGAGECVSLSALYAAAVFIVAGIPLSDIYMMATPLHSQNYLDVDDGVLTNNRRIVTKNMWFNGTAISAQARRALENERVTVISHHTGHIHSLYENATMSRAAYRKFSGKLSNYLEVELADDTLGNFLRHSRDIQKCFQFRWERLGKDCFVGAERIFAYEHGSNYRFTDNTRPKLMDEMDGEEFQYKKLPSRIVLNDLEEYVRKENIDFDNRDHVEALRRKFSSDCLNAAIAIEDMIKFCRVRPRLPDPARKRFLRTKPLDIDGRTSREEIIEYLEGMREHSVVADLAFYAYRDLTRTEPGPFLAAATRRNPVSVAALSDVDEQGVASALERMENESIYDERGRLAQPDEVWNYSRGDGLEKAILLANILSGRRDSELKISIEGSEVTLHAGKDVHRFKSGKGLPDQEWSVVPRTH